jgi:cytochrome P450
MTQTIPAGPFDGGVRRLDDDYPARAALRAAGPLVRCEAPAGGPVWIVTDEALARAVLADDRLVKDPAWAPPDWDPRTAKLEPPAAAMLSLTTQEGAPHARLRRAHAPLLSARRMRARAPGVRAQARTLLADLAAIGGPVDLCADFTTRFPLTVICTLLGVPAEHVDAAVAGCRHMHETDDLGAAIGALARLGATALAPGRTGLAADLRARLPAEVTDDQVASLLFALIFAGQLTTDAALGFVLARVLVDGVGAAGTTALVDDVLRVHPPAPFTLWRFAAVEIELAGQILPTHAPVLVDIRGIDTDPARRPGPTLSFGAGAHYCIGAQLARVELVAVADVLVTDFPDARLAVPAADLRRVDPGGIEGSRLAALPVRLRPC